MLEEAFDKVKNQMGPCGTVCAVCDLGNGTIAEIAHELKQNLQSWGILKWASQVSGGSEIDFNNLNKSLDWINTYIRCLGCEKGGGPPGCSIRICAKERGYELCSECPELEECKNFNWLTKSHKRLKEKLREGKTKETYISEAITSVKK
jgi:hypothetical protein